MAIDLTAIGRSLGEGLSQMGSYSAKAAAQANSISAAAQSAQGQFNQQSANLANLQNQEAMINQYQYNSAQASMANDFTEAMWQRTADWNERMWEKQAEFNAEQADIQRQWQERMANTQYQRAVTDMQKSGLNPILAVTSGGVGTGVPGGATATVGGSSMSSAQGAMASGGLLSANTASEGNYSGQMEYLSGTLGLISALVSGLATASGAAGSLGDVGEGIMDVAGSILSGEEPKQTKTAVDVGNEWGKKTKDFVTNAAQKVKNFFTGEKENVVNKRTVDNYNRTQQRMNNWYRFKGEIHG